MRRLRAHLARYPRSRHALEARWFLAWSLYREGDLAGADAAFADFAARHGDSALAAGAAYWRARIAGRRGEAEAEREELLAVMRRWPSSSYAWFAAERLGLRQPGLAVASPDPEPSPAIEPILALARVGLVDWARIEARHTEVRSLDRVRALLAAGDYAGARAVVAHRCGSPASFRGPATLREACWPRPARAAVEAVARPAGLDPLLPFAIMNAESAMRPEVVSPAGARGLMQLMPEVAARLAAGDPVLGGGAFHADLLFLPAVNARLGTRELAELARRFAAAPVEPRLPLVIAGYNAGADAVQRWLDAAPPGTEADEWAEDIGYTETRRYVRRVLSGLQTWRLAYGDGYAAP